MMEDFIKPLMLTTRCTSLRRWCSSMTPSQCSTLNWTLKRYIGALMRAKSLLWHFLIVGDNNKLAECIYWQFRHSMSHGESLPEGDLTLNELITIMQLSLREMQTSGVVTARTVTSLNPGLFCPFRFLQKETSLKKYSVMRTEKLCVLYLDQGRFWMKIVTQ